MNRHLAPEASAAEVDAGLFSSLQIFQLLLFLCVLTDLVFSVVIIFYFSVTLSCILNLTIDVIVHNVSVLLTSTRLLRVDLIKSVSNVHPPVRTSVCTSTKSFFDFNEIWHVGRGRRVMHDGMQYDPIQGQGHEPLKVGNSAIFDGYLFPHL